jgi:hypothetical protein
MMRMGRRKLKLGMRVAVFDREINNFMGFGTIISLRGGTNAKPHSKKSESDSPVISLARHGDQISYRANQVCWLFRADYERAVKMIKREANA